MISLFSVFSFLKSPMGMLIAGAIAFAGWTTYQRHDAARDAKAKCEAAHAAATLKEIARQDKVADVAQKRAEEAWKKASDELNKLKELRNEILNTSGAKDYSCILPDTIRRKLSDIK